jgi:hypothetical protein
MKNILMNRNMVGYMDEKGFITVTEGRFTAYLDEMLPITFG